MANNPPQHATHLLPSRPFSPSFRQRNTASPSMAPGSATQTITNTPQRSESPEPQLVLRLRGAHSPTASISDTAEGGTRRRRRPRIQWAEDVIDNEGLGRKKSKICCIYHKPRAVGESSDESSSDSSSESDSDNSGFEDGARPVRGGKGRGKKHEHGSGSGDECGGHGHGHEHEHGRGRRVKQARQPSPNAYEKMPKYDVKPLTEQPGSGSG